MPIHNTKYTNPAGTNFTIQIDRLAVPGDANYWGYSIVVREQPKGPQKSFRGLILKSTAATQALADAFVLTDPLEFVRHSLLDNYDNGSTPIYWPNLAPGWVVI